MTDVLRETLEERGRATPWQDVDGLVAAGDRRVRRCRVAGAATLAVLAAVGVAVPYVVSGVGGTDQGQVAVDDPADAAPVSWSEGTVVHVGDREVDLGQQPEAYVLTDDGVVWIDAETRVHFTDLDGEGEKIGRSRSLAGRLLVGEGSLAAWYDSDLGAFTVFETSTMSLVREFPVVSNGTGGDQLKTPSVRAIDGGILWAYSDNTATGVDVASRNLVESLRARWNVTLADVRDGHLAVEGEAGLNTQSSTTEVRGPDATTLASVPGGGRALLSPDARYVATESSSPDDTYRVWDVVTETEVTPEHGGDFHVVVRWLDDDSYQALALDAGNRPDSVDVLVCSVATDGCEVVAGVGPEEQLEVPTGESLE